jgi:cell division protein FtsB
MKYPSIRIGYGLALMMAVVYAFFTMRGPHGISAWMEKRQQIRQLEENNATLMRENQDRRDYIERLDKSRDEQELVIRERLKLVKPNEKVFMKRPE